MTLSIQRFLHDNHWHIKINWQFNQHPSKFDIEVLFVWSVRLQCYHSKFLGFHCGPVCQSRTDSPVRYLKETDSYWAFPLSSISVPQLTSVSTSFPQTRIPMKRWPERIGGSQQGIRLSWVHFVQCVYFGEAFFYFRKSFERVWNLCYLCKQTANNTEFDESYSIP